MRSANLTHSALTEKVIDRFRAKVEKKADDECWSWTGARNTAGYGKVRINGKTYPAHRVAFCIIHGEVSGQVHITCGNRLCCNPSHLAVDTKPRRYRRAAKPYRDFPLTPHLASGKWCKKIRGKVEYFGRIDDPDGALREYQAAKDQLLAGLPRQNDGITVAEVADHFLCDRESLVESGELKRRTWRDYYAHAQKLVGYFGKDKPVEGITLDDLAAYRAHLAKGVTPITLSSRVRHSRMILIHAYDADLIDRPLKLGKRFVEPKKRTLREYARDRGAVDFGAHEINKLLTTATPMMRAMILLGVNTGVGNADIGQMRSTDIDGGWLDFPRVKTLTGRECPLWDETVDAIRTVRRDDANPLMFLTSRGEAWYKDSKANPLARQFTKLQQRCGIHKRGRSFYGLRRTFETVGGDLGDPTAVDFMMGHLDETMAGVYRQRIFRDRLVRVTDHIHDWLFVGKR